MEEKISIIIPIHNGEKYIKQTIDNILNQTYHNWELILIDDGSNDCSRDIINEYKSEKIRIFCLKENSGPAIARNVGLKNARGRYICFQDADDLWENDKLEKQIKFMQKNEYEFTYTGYKYIGKIRKRKVSVPLKLSYKKALKNMKILTISVMIDTKKISKEFIKMPNVPCEDVATWWNILKKGFIAYGLNECLVLYRRTDKTLTSHKLRWSKNRWNLYRNVERLSFIKSLYYFICYAINGILKRI